MKLFILIFILLAPLTSLNLPDYVNHKFSGEHVSQSDEYNLINSLPRDYVIDGTEDYTFEIQLALDKYKKVVFPGFPLLINDKGLKVRSNSSLRFLKGAELRLVPSLKTHYAILDIKRVKNVIIHNPVIRGDRYTHLGSKGEWGMGIRINASSNIKILGAVVSDCWGDGIYIGQDNFINSSNIVIKDAFLRKNRRDGISIIAVDGLLLENIHASFQDGTKPMCGINFETNNPLCEIKNVNVVNPKTEHNQGSGIQIALSTMLGGGAKKIDVRIINHVDVGSRSFALKVASNRKEGVVGGSVSGKVVVINPSWNRTIGDRPLAFVTDQTNLKVDILSPKVTNSKGKQLGIGSIRSIFDKHSNGDLSIL